MICESIFGCLWSSVGFWTTSQPLWHIPYNCSVLGLRTLIFLPLWTLCDSLLTHTDLGAFLCQVCYVIGLESGKNSKWTISSARPELDKTRHISAVICVVLGLLLWSWSWNEGNSSREVIKSQGLVKGISVALKSHGFLQSSWSLLKHKQGSGMFGMPTLVVYMIPLFRCSIRRDIHRYEGPTYSKSSYLVFVNWLKRQQVVV